MTDAASSIVAIDIGTSKISVLVARAHAPDQIEVTGMVHVPNKGMSKGAIKNMDKVVLAIKDAVSQAEEMSDCRIHSAWVGMPSPDLKSFNASGRTPVLTGTVSTTEIVRAREMAKSSHLMPDHYLINTVQLGIGIDDQQDWVEQPVGMSATFISGHYHLMMLPINTMQNIERAMKAAGVGIDRMIVSSLATAEAMLLHDERQQGVCLIDIGAGTTNIAVYLEGHLILSHTLPQGGEHVTRDLVTLLQTSFEQAEQLKIRHGCLDPQVIKKDQMIQVAGVGVEPGFTISRIELSEMISARYEKILHAVRRQLEDSGAINVLRHGVVVSGDASQIEGMVSMTRRILGVQAHLGNAPLTVTAANESRLPILRRSVYATAIGLLLYSQNEQQQLAEANPETPQRATLGERMASSWQHLMNKLKQVF